MAEQIDLATPVPLGTVTKVIWDRVTMNIADKSIYLQWQDDLGRGYSATYPTPIPPGSPNTVTGQQMLSTINKGNHTTSSMARKLFTQLQTDGYIPPGAITGTPE